MQSGKKELVYAFQHSMQQQKCSLCWCN